jgi:hypothetical protein
MGKVDIRLKLEKKLESYREKANLKQESAQNTAKYSTICLIFYHLTTKLYYYNESNP